MKKGIIRILEYFNIVIFKKSFLPFGISIQDDSATYIPPKQITTVFDIGANVGNLSRKFNKDFPNATIYAFEPVPSTFQILKESTSAFHRIKPYNIGFSSSPGKATIYLQQDNGLNSINAAVNRPDAKMNSTSIEVDIHTVADFCTAEKLTTIDLLKTDTEGLDLEVLKGCEAFLKKGQIGFILSEVGFYEDNERNTSFETLRKYLQPFGYRLLGFYDQSHFGNTRYLTCAMQFSHYKNRDAV